MSNAPPPDEDPQRAAVDADSVGVTAEGARDPSLARHSTGFWALASLFGLYYFNQGFGEPGAGLLAQPLQKLLHSFGKDTDTIGLFMGVLTAPWWIKPIYGLLTDFVPIAGYRRKSYLLLTGGLTIVGFVALCYLPLGPEYTWTLLFC